MMREEMQARYGRHFLDLGSSWFREDVIGFLGTGGRGCVSASFI